MTITQTLRNMSPETPVAVNIAPPTGFTTVRTETNGNSVTVWQREVGDIPSHPHVRRIEIRDADLFHPDTAVSYKGRRVSVTSFTTINVSDDVADTSVELPLQVKVELAFGGPVLLEHENVLQYLLTNMSALWSGVTTGVPDAGVMMLVAVGVVDLP